MPEETIASEVVAASLGGALSASILYPLEVLKTKMQAVDDEEEEEEKSMIPFALKIYKEEGSGVFFRGIESSAFQSALEKALYFFSYTVLKEVHRTISGGAQLDGVTNLALGCVAEWAHLPISLPVDAWTTKIKTSKEAPMKILLTMLSDRDTKFYKGISAYYLLCFKPALQYTVYEQVKQAVVKNRPHKSLSAAEAFFLGMVARAVSTVIVFPFLRAKVLVQTSEQKSTSSVLVQQYQRAGIGGLYQGIGPELTRGVFSSALMLMIKERIAEVVRLLLAPPQYR